MKRLFLVTICLTLLTVFVCPFSLAEPLAQEARSKISSPQMNAEVRGTVLIEGTAWLPELNFYKIEFGVGPNPTDWMLIGDTHSTPVIEGVLETWDTTQIPDGSYSVRLRVVRPDGNYDEFFARQIQVANTRPTETPTPTRAPTLRPTNTPAATPTLIIIQPTTVLELPTPTATLARPTRAVTSPLGSLQDYQQAFFLGAGAMGAVLLVLGLIFAIRRLL